MLGTIYVVSALYTFVKMYLSTRAAFVRNVAVAIVNGSITLMLLLIAPLGLAAVITNTVLVTVATFGVCSVADWIVAWLLPSSSSAEILSQTSRRGNLRRFDQNKKIERRNRDW